MTGKDRRYLNSLWKEGRRRKKKKGQALSGTVLAALVKVDEKGLRALRTGEAGCFTLDHVMWVIKARPRPRQCDFDWMWMRRGRTIVSRWAL